MTTNNETPLPGGCRVIQLPRINDERGNLTYIHGNDEVPFDIRRAYYLYDIPGGAARGGHAHKNLHQFLISLSGSFDVLLDDGSWRTTVRLNRADTGLYLGPMVWRELENFSCGSVCMVLASERYDESDYIREYEDFVACGRRAA